MPRTVSSAGEIIDEAGGREARRDGNAAAPAAKGRDHLLERKTRPIAVAAVAQRALFISPFARGLEFSPGVEQQG